MQRDVIIDRQLTVSPYANCLPFLVSMINNLNTYLGTDSLTIAYLHDCPEMSDLAMSSDGLLSCKDLARVWSTGICQSPFSEVRRPKPYKRGGLKKGCHSAAWRKAWWVIEKLTGVMPRLVQALTLLTCPVPLITAGGHICQFGRSESAGERSLFSQMFITNPKP